MANFLIRYEDGERIKNNDGEVELLNGDDLYWLL